MPRQRRCQRDVPDIQRDVPDIRRMGGRRDEGVHRKIPKSAPAGPPQPKNGGGAERPRLRFVPGEWLTRAGTLASRGPFYPRDR
jgi:hypothetical protein